VLELLDQIDVEDALLAKSLEVLQEHFAEKNITKQLKEAKH
jgi:hypothetical protein